MKLYRLVLISIFLLFFAVPTFAYQTVAMEFPGNWYKINYINNDRDAIVQFVRTGYTAQNWEESIVFHTFKWSRSRGLTAKNLLYSLLKDVERKNPTIKIQFLRLDNEETMASWCVEKTSTMPAHCELIRTTQSFEGPLSMHYINKNSNDYWSVRPDWIYRMSKAKVYQSYFRLDRVLNKSMTFEL